ncbi:MAG: biotin-dependent carboxyltransferase family protein [Hyphomicrobiaceae bacterium]
MTRLVIKTCGALTTLQDAGRRGYQRYGLSNAGAMDRTSLAIANALVGNKADVAVIEFAVFGGELVVEGGVARIAMAGADCPLDIDGEPVPALTSRRVAAGGSIRIGAARAGVFAYLAVAGSFDVAPMLGSVSVHLRAHVGGLNGAPLKAGDALQLRTGQIEGPDLELAVNPDPGPGPIRVVLGPQDDLFARAGIETLLSSEYQITVEADRMGYRLSGPKIGHADGYNIVSDGIVTGSVQVPGTGEPIVLLADRQTTGGYPKIATIVRADLSRFVQMRPGSKVRFAVVTLQEAVALARSDVRRMENLIGAIRPAGLNRLDSARLLGLNLAGEAVDAAAGGPSKAS